MFPLQFSTIFIVLMDEMHFRRGFTLNKVCIVYASMTGNTEEISNIIKDTLNEKIEVDSFAMDLIDVADVLHYDFILLGAYTYGDGDIPYEAEDFYDQLDETNLTGKKFACFGSGDSFYEYYCHAPVLFERRIEERGGIVVVPTLKIELAPDDELQKQKCIDFANEVLKHLGN